MPMADPVLLVHITIVVILARSFLVLPCYLSFSPTFLKTSLVEIELFVTSTNTFYKSKVADSRIMTLNN